MKKRRNVFCGLIFLLLGQLTLAGQEVARITVYPGGHWGKNCPVSVEIDHPVLRPGVAVYLMEPSAPSPVAVPCQWEEGSPPRLWWIMNGTTEAYRERTFLLYTGEQSGSREISLKDNSAGLSIMNGSLPVLTYRYTVYPLPADVDSSFSRTGFIHPLYTPSGDTLTRIMPPDHYHHYGLWNPWTNTVFQGRKVDFWNLGQKRGTVRFAGFISRSTGNVYGGFRSLHQHVDLSSPGGETIALDEEWEVRVWNCGLENIFIIDFLSVLSPSTEDGILLEAYRYGGFGFRATENWNNRNSEILTSEGRTREDADASRAKWCKISGELPNGRGGILFLSHSSNREHPEPVRCWPPDANRGKGDIFFNFSPTRENDWQLHYGHSYRLLYRMVLFTGETGPEDAVEWWKMFVRPPSAKAEFPEQANLYKRKRK